MNLTFNFVKRFDFQLISLINIKKELIKLVLFVLFYIICYNFIACGNAISNILS